MPLKTYSNWMGDKNNYIRINDSNVMVHLIVDMVLEHEILSNMDGIKILLMIEPHAIVSNTRQHAIECSEWYDYIITYDSIILDNCKNAKFLVYGTCWIYPEEYNSIEPSDKKFQMSSITGHKNMTKGHRLRQELLARQHEIILQTLPFRNPKLKQFDIPILGDSKLPLFRDSKFSLVIENSRQENYFTEKLLDCLLTLTIPVYYGAPNISDFFDTTGWIILESDCVDNCITIINQIEDNYDFYSEIMLKNKKIALDYSSYSRRLELLVNELII